MDLVWYHGTTRPFKRLRPSARGLFGRGVYLTSDAADAQGYGPWLAIVRTCVRRPLKAKVDYTLGQLLEHRGSHSRVDEARRQAEKGEKAQSAATPGAANNVRLCVLRHQLLAIWPQTS